ncbi:hypothetical protein SDC9_99591 [bioreactor metagenome]|uniref:Uncharacterized protein n=1 Tax=bioreactor metagenome TaxID=1076179 RepID=A0A645AJB9_9ZZZZ
MPFSILSGRVMLLSSRLHAITLRTTERTASAAIPPEKPARKPAETLPAACKRAMTATLISVISTVTRLTAPNPTVNRR